MKDLPQPLAPVLLPLRGSALLLVYTSYLVERRTSSFLVAVS